MGPQEGAGGGLSVVRRLLRALLVSVIDIPGDGILDPELNICTLNHLIAGLISE